MQKQIIKVIGGIVLILISQTAKASEKNDVVKISMPNKSAIEIAGLDINKYPIDTAFISENIQRFFNFCKASNVEEMMQQAPRLFEIKEVDYKENGYKQVKAENKFYALDITERKIPNEIISSASFDKSLYYLQKHQLEFSSNLFTYKIMFDEMEQLEAYQGHQLKNALKSIMQSHLDKKSKHIEKIHYALDTGYSFEKIYENEKRLNNQIEINFGPGLENVKNTWAASIETSIALSLSSKGINKNSFSLHYEWQYDFSSPNVKNINQFMSLGYRHDFSIDPDESKPYTFKLGYLTNQQGNLYNKNTFRVGVSRSIGNRFSIEPQIYFNNFFRDAIPSIKLGIGF